jgi:hypothetical protein
MENAANFSLMGFSFALMGLSVEGRDLSIAEFREDSLKEINP